MKKSKGFQNDTVVGFNNVSGPLSVIGPERFYFLTTM